MWRAVILVLGLVWAVSAYDLRTVTCHPWFGKWDCWYAQRCGNELNTCLGDAPDAPPWSAIAHGWIIFAGILGGLFGLAILGGMIAGIVFLVRKMRRH
jgi:hypothetical protein